MPRKRRAHSHQKRRLKRKRETSRFLPGYCNQDRGATEERWNAFRRTRQSQRMREIFCFFSIPGVATRVFQMPRILHELEIAYRRLVLRLTYCVELHPVVLAHDFSGVRTHKVSCSSKSARAAAGIEKYNENKKKGGAVLNSGMPQRVSENGIFQLSYIHADIHCCCSSRAFLN